jgi:FlgD Ig-like domain
MKCIIIIILILGSESIIYSQSYHMNIKLKDGSRFNYPIEEIRKMDFDNVTRIDDTEKMNRILNSFILKQNYPNPFNPSTSIEYELAKPGLVNVSIFNSNGQLIKKLVDDFRSKGSFKTNWSGINSNGLKVSSGIYIYSVKVDNLILSKKMVLLK